MPTITVFEAKNGTLSLDPNVLRLEVDLNHLLLSGARVQRYNFDDDADTFAEYPKVLEHLSREEECLPMVMVDDEIVSLVSYPSREQLAQWAGVILAKVGGCGGGTCTCGG